MPRKAEAACYCIREALKEIPQAAESEKRQPWRVASREAVDAKQRFEIARSLPGAETESALTAMLRAIDDLELVHSQERIHQQRLLAVMAARTGASPIPSAPVRAYQELVEHLDDLLHSTATMEAATDAFDSALALLRQLFMPPELRLPELASLAELATPTPDDASQVRARVASPRHLEYFFERVVTADWLTLLDDSDLLAPPEGQGNWPISRLVTQLKETAPEGIAHWLMTAFNRWATTSSRSAWFVGRAALDLGAPGRAVVLAALRAHPNAPGVAHLGMSLVEALDPHEDIIVDVADLLLNPSGGLDGWFDLKSVTKPLSVGVSTSNWRRRVDMLSHKLAAVIAEPDLRFSLDYERAGSIVDPSGVYDHERPAILLRALIDVLSSSRAAGVPGADLLEAAGSLHEELRPRVRAWVLAQWDEAPVEVVYDELTTAIATRRPTGDDLPLIDRIVSEAPPGYLSAWRTALGTAPAAEEVGTALADGSPEKSWMRVREWAALLPDPVSTDWSKAIAVLSGAFGPTSRESLVTRSSVEVGHGTSPLSEADLRAMDITTAAKWIARWRPDPNAWMVGSRELARTLEAVVKKAPHLWAASPIATISQLREPVYVSHYFRGLSGAELEVAWADDLVEAIAFARAHPWNPAPIGRDAFDYDPTWTNADVDGVALIRSLADNDVGFGEREASAWAIALEAASSTDEPTEFDDSRMAAINRGRTRALETVFALMGWEYRQTQAVRAEALDLLDSALRIPGRDGEQHRAIIAPRLPFLRLAAPEWLTDRVALIFGKEAPDGLAQAAVDLYAQWGQPYRWVYERIRGLLLDAVSRDVPNAISSWCIAVLWQVDGYGVDESVNRLASLGDAFLSRAGETLGRLLRHKDTDRGQVAIAVEIFEAVLRLKRPGALSGFGWFAEVRTMDESVWLDLTVRAAGLSGGRLDWSHEVADRAAASDSPQSLAILNDLVRGLPDEWDRGQVMEKALTALKRAVPMRNSEPYRRLRTSLLERGMFEAENL